MSEKEKQFVRTLDKEIESGEKLEGFMVKELSPGQVLEIKTENSTYWIIVLDPVKGRVKLSGGSTVH